MRRQEGHLPEKPTSTSLPVGSSDIESDDVTAYVAKRRKEGEDERGPGPSIQNPVADKEITKEERIVKMENQC
ncbi:hypothetical protein H5410_047001 [Solanum commersonii]|uniref:Uncharacterized protein n=1 Tax=Solanum commersonii TaxID=4109 RepID=A0A9J5XG00_SOLCO|nr:hypothetical protein H5410_047001 [Solanum commersonii]